MTKKIYSGDGFFRDRYRCVVDGGAAKRTKISDFYILLEFSLNFCGQENKLSAIFEEETQEIGKRLEWHIWYWDTK